MKANRLAFEVGFNIFPTIPDNVVRITACVWSYFKLNAPARVNEFMNRSHQVIIQLIHAHELNHGISIRAAVVVGPRQQFEAKFSSLDFPISEHRENLHRVQNIVRVTRNAFQLAAFHAVDHTVLVCAARAPCSFRTV